MFATRVCRLLVTPRSPSTAPSTPFNVLLLGAGPINFGSTEGPWNHTKRLEQKLSSRLNIVGLIEQDTARAERVLTIKRADDNVKTGYERTRVFSSVKEASEVLQGSNAPHLAVNGLPARARGTTLAGKDSEMQLLEHFPNMAMFIEKPLSDVPDMAEVEKVGQKLKGRVTSVGYMLRYLKAVQEMKKIIEENNLNVMYTMATYLMAYSYASERPYPYWFKDKESGPIVSQGTHICDLNRYLAPEIILPSIKVNTVESTDPAGQLSLLAFDEKSTVGKGNTVSKVTSASWRYENGAVGNLVHGVCLHEGDYDVELVIVADGWKLKLVDPYGTAPKLYVKRPGSTEEVRTVFTDDDCYLSEFSAIIDVIDGTADASVILSSYEDAIESYKLTWAITRAGEQSWAARGGPAVSR
ncbi:hypothetical protein IAU60_004102 [Kwoniella sp. DSM 27419]